MTNFNIYNELDAPEASKATLEKLKKGYGFVPNLLGALAESNPALTSYLDLGKKLSESSFTPQEQQLLFLTISYENECSYCMAAHTAGAKRAKLPDEEINSLRLGESLEDSKLNTLANFARLMFQKRGWVDEKDIDDFLNAGYTKANIFDVIIALAMKTLSNYTNHIVDTTLDESISKFKWDQD